MGVDFYDGRDPTNAVCIGTLGEADAVALLSANETLASALGVDLHGDWKISGEQIEQMLAAMTRNTISDEAASLLNDLAKREFVYGFGD
ncbi:MAG: hypothetical protein AAF557_11460 [Pseudomonadota bacterium]